MLALALDDLGERAPYVLFVCGGNVIPGAANAGLADGHGFSGGIRGAAGVLRQEITPSPLRSDRPTSPPANGILRYTGLVTITTETIEDLDGHVAALEQAAIQANCETRLLAGQQAQAFTAAALSLCRQV